VEAAGKQPRQVLAEHGITVFECTGLISDIASMHFQGGDITPFKIRSHKAGCAGMGGGCG
jgi:nitrogen fixation protein NifB